MKKVKELCRSFIIFVVAMGMSVILPTLLLRTEDEIITLFQRPEYWVVSAFIAAVITWLLVRANSNK